MLRNIADSAKAGKTAADVPPAVYEQFDRIRQLRAKDPVEALAELDNMLIVYPANATMHQLKCAIMLVKPGRKIRPRAPRVRGSPSSRRAIRPCTLRSARRCSRRVM